MIIKCFSTVTCTVLHVCVPKHIHFRKQDNFIAFTSYYKQCLLILQQLAFFLVIFEVKFKTLDGNIANGKISVKFHRQKEP